MSKPTLVIMAAGMGSRYGGLKQIDPVGPSGEIIMDYSIHDAINNGFGKVVFIIRHDFENEFREAIGKRIEKKVDVDYCFQNIAELPAPFVLPDGRTKPWGTGQAILSCKGTVKEPFAAINADDFYGQDAFKVMAEYLATAEDKPSCYDYSMVGYILKNTLTDHGHVSRGICELENGYLKSIYEGKYIQKFGDVIKVSDDKESWREVSGDSVASMSFWGFTPSIIDEMDERFPLFLEKSVNVPGSEFLLPTVVGDIITEKKASVKVLSSTAQWYGVTYKEDKEYVMSAIRGMVDKGDYPQSIL